MDGLDYIPYSETGSSTAVTQYIFNHALGGKGVWEGRIRMQAECEISLQTESKDEKLSARQMESRISHCHKLSVIQ